MTPAPHQDELNVKNTETVKMPAEQHRRSLAIRKVDWERVKRCLDGVQKPQAGISTWYSILFGVAASAGLTIIPLAFTKDLPPSVLPLYICATAASLLLAITLVRLEKSQAGREQYGLSFVKAEMSAIEDMYKNVPEPDVEL